jgi:hypothetical protein
VVHGSARARLQRRFGVNDIGGIHHVDASEVADESKTAEYKV